MSLPTRRISPAFRCSVVTNATGVPRAVLVGSITYESAKNLSKICKPQVICSNQIAGIVLFSLTLFRVESPWGRQTILSCFAAAEFENIAP